MDDTYQASERVGEHVNVDRVARESVEPVEEQMMLTASEQNPVCATASDCRSSPDRDLNAAAAECLPDLAANIVETGIEASESTIRHLEEDTDGCSTKQGETLIDVDKAATLLSSGLMEALEREINASRKIFSDIIKHEEVVLESIQHENAKFSDDAVQNLGKQMAKVQQYIGKLAKIRKDMVHIKEQTESLKRTAAKLVVQHQKRVMDKEEELRQKQSQMKSLVAQPAKPPGTG